MVSIIDLLIDFNGMWTCLGLFRLIGLVSSPMGRVTWVQSQVASYQSL